MKSLLKKNLKEVEEKRKLKRLTFHSKYKRWIGLTVYPFFMLFTFLTANGQRGLTPLQNLDFDQVREVTSPALHPLDLYYANLSDVMELILVENDDRFEELKANEAIRLKTLKAINVHPEWGRFVEAEIKLQWAFVNFKYGNDWDAFWGLRSANKAVKKNLSSYPSFLPNKRTSGLLNIIFGNVPAKNKWLMNLFGLKGDIFSGIAQLEEVRNSSLELKDEALLVLGMVNAYLLEDFEQAINDMANGNLQAVPLYAYVQSLIYLKAHQSLLAREALQNSKKQFPIHDYLIGETYFQAGDYHKAIYHYQSFLKAYKGSSYVKDTYLKIAMSHGFMGDINSYENYLSKSKIEGDKNSEVDKNAVKIINEINDYNPTLLRVRFAIDGGFYTKADSLISVIEGKNDISDYERLELTYRKARLKHIQGDTQGAMAHYHQVINNAELISETYYGPNSFLQMGYLMRHSNPEVALMYFNKVLSFKKHPYKTSLDNKATIAIKLLEKQDD